MSPSVAIFYLALKMTPSPFRIIQWNARSALANKKSLEMFLFQKNISVALINETWFKPGKIVNFVGYNIVREDRPDARSGIAIFIKNNIHYTEITNFYKIHNVLALAVKIIFEGTNITFVTFYNNPMNNIKSQEWVKFFSSFQGPLVIGADTNCHHIAWGCDKIDRKGIELLDAVGLHNLVILNDGKPTLLETSSQINKSVIDLFFTTPELSHNFSCFTFDELLGSNHYPLILESNSLICNSSILKQPIRKWNVKNANWDIYRQEMTNFSSSVQNSNDYCSYDLFYENCERACELSMPKVQFFNANEKFRKPWWSKACEEEVSKRREKLKIYRDSPSIANLIEYKKADAHCKRICKEETRKAWVSFTNKLNRHTKISDIWNSLKKLKNRKTSNKLPIKKGDWSDDLINSLAPPYVPQEIHIDPILNDNEIGDKMNDVFSLTELQAAIKTGLNTAPGSDNVHYPMIENLSEISKEQLLHIYNDMWVRAKIPEKWRELIVVPFLKPGKTPESHSSYRPIALASCLLKTFERMVKLRLDWWLENNNILPRSQYGFRKSRSIQEAQASLILDINQGFLEQKSTLAVFYDIVGAYSNVQIPILMQKLNKIKLPKRMQNIVYEIIHLRKLFLRVDNELFGPHFSYLGLGQGDILSCPLYSIYIYDIEEKLPPNIALVQFVDDFCMYVTDKNIENCVKNSIIGINYASSYMGKIGLTLSLTKTEACFFTTKRTLSTLPNCIVAKDLSVEIKKRVRFLGLLMDVKLNWKPHIDLLTIKSNKYLNIMKMICNKHWGMSPTIALNYYKATIRATLDFGSIFYSQSCNSKLLPLNKTQNQALRLAMGYLNSTPIDNILVECREEPMTSRMIKLVTRFVLKSISCQKQIANKLNYLAITHLTSKRCRSKPMPPLVDYYCSISHEYGKEIHTSEKPLIYTQEYNLSQTFLHHVSVTQYRTYPANCQDPIFQNEIQEKWPGAYTIYTDASKINDEVGAAWYDPASNSSACFKLNPATSTYSAEIIGILEALKYSSTLSENKILILTDCKSAVQKLTNNCLNTPPTHLHIEVLKTYYASSLTKTIQIAWVKGHEGVRGNQKVDALARHAAVHGQMKHFPLSPSDLRCYTEDNKNFLLKLTDKTNGKGLFYKRNFEFVTKKPWFIKSKMPRKFLVIFNRLRTNHAICADYLNKIHLKDTNLCAECGEKENMEHLLMTCKIYAAERKIFFKKIEKLITHPFNYNVLITDEKLYPTIYRFILRCRIKP